MVTNVKYFVALLGLGLLSFWGEVRGDDDDKPLDNSVKPAVESLPSFNLPDPSGASHTNAELNGKKTIIVVTVPTKEQGGNQKAWVSGIIEQNPGAGKDYNLILLQDMTQSGNKEMVMDNLKKSWKPGNPTLILVDDAATFRSALEAQRGLMTDKTTVLVYDESGKLVYFDRTKPTVTAVKALSGKLSAK